MTDVAHFDHILDLILQRKYGKIRRTWNGHLIGKSRRLLRLLKTAAIIVSAGIVFILFYCFLAVTKQRIILTYAFHHSSMSLSLPFSSNASSDASGSSQKSSFTQAQFSSGPPTTSSKLIHDTLKVHDTVRIFPRWNAALKSKTTTVASPGNANVASPISKPPAPSAIVSKPDAPSTPPAIQGTAKTAYDSLQ